MKKLSVLSALLLGVASLGLSSGALASYDDNPVGNSIHATTGAVSDLGEGAVDAAKDVGAGTVDAAHGVGTAGKDVLDASGDAVKAVGQGAGDVLTGGTGKE